MTKQRRINGNINVNMVYEMDQFAGDLVKAVEDRGEPAVVVFYGDHLPTMGLTAEDLKSRYLYNTNYVIWVTSDWNSRIEIFRLIS